MSVPIFFFSFCFAFCWLATTFLFLSTARKRASLLRFCMQPYVCTWSHLDVVREYVSFCLFLHSVRCDCLQLAILLYTQPLQIGQHSRYVSKKRMKTKKTVVQHTNVNTVQPLTLFLSLRHSCAPIDTSFDRFQVHNVELFRCTSANRSAGTLAKTEEN